MANGLWITGFGEDFQNVVAYPDRCLGLREKLITTPRIQIESIPFGELTVCCDRGQTDTSPLGESPAPETSPEWDIVVIDDRLLAIEFGAVRAERELPHQLNEQIRINLAGQAGGKLACDFSRPCALPDRVVLG